MSADPRTLEAEGERVWVSTVRERDLATYGLAVEQSRQRLSQWNPVTPTDLAAHLRGQSRNHRTFVIHAHDVRGEHDIVGKVNVTNVVRGRLLSAAMGYDAYDPYVGHGLFAEGLRLVVDLAFAPEPEGMGLHRVEASVRPGNATSSGVLRSLGFQVEGFSSRLLLLPDASGGEEWRDHDRFAITREQWPAAAYAPPVRRRRVLLVNGVPGSGKTTLARAVAAELGVPMLSKELLEEAVADALWSLLEHSPAGAVVEGWFWPDDARFVKAGMAQCGLDPALVPEVWCDVPTSVARQRFERRHVAGERHPVHDARMGFDGFWERVEQSAQPLGLGPTVRVDTSAPLRRRDVVALALLVPAANG